ncbi:NAD(P)H-quinone oxidoreductase [Kineococcus sp. GCM10028916]|uniref:NAD(P)H-quinone oxidoreductase n=1 Tax=Kineococcus sp. GCM10028916 TaxID=3273394 RepID=UPI0036286443
MPHDLLPHPRETPAVVFDHPGPPEVLHWGSAQLREVGPHDVAIDVHAAGVNNADLLQRRGAYAVPAHAPDTLGLECAGRIAQVGSQVQEWEVGDAVCALLVGGGYAQRVVVPAAQVLPLPSGMDFVHAAALPEAVCTVYSTLAMTAGVGPGDTVLVHGGGSGIGTTAIQWALAVGARVLATAGSDAKVQRVADLGATAINYRTSDFVDEVLRATGGRGVDAVLDIVGVPYLARNIECLAPDGHLVIIGGDVSTASLDLSLLQKRRARISVTTLRARSDEQKAAIVRAVRDRVWPHVEAGRLTPVIDTVLPATDAARAHELLSAGGTFGKVVLQFSDPGSSINC